MGRKRNEECRKHVTEVENDSSRWICKYCNNEFGGGASRIEAHLGLNGKRGNIRRCSNYPPVAGNEGVHNNNNMASTSSNPPPEAVIDRVVFQHKIKVSESYFLLVFWLIDAFNILVIIHVFVEF